MTDVNGNGIPDDAHAHLTNVRAGTTILMYVKFGPGSKGMTLPVPKECRNLNRGAAENVAGGTFSDAATAELIVLPKDR